MRFSSNLLVCSPGTTPTLFVGARSYIIFWKSKKTNTSDSDEEETRYQELPRELVYDILTVLPVKTLKRFQCVSEQWCSIISQPSFQQDHYNHQTKRDPHRLSTRYIKNVFYKDIIVGIQQLFTYGNDGTLINSIFLEVPVEIKQIQSCQGLVCLTDSEEDYILVCNPSTKEIISLPPPPTSNGCRDIGFGFAASTKEFKVVKFLNFEETEEKFWCEVFTLGSFGWREGYYYTGVPFLNGALHLLPYHSEPNVTYSIQVFDIQIEEYTKITLPEVYSNSGSNTILDMKLLVFCGFLWLTFESQSNLELWYLKDYNSQNWGKVYVIVLNSFPCVSGETLAIMPDGHIVVSINFAIGNRKQYFYNPREIFFILNTIEDYKTTTYVESLFSFTFLGIQRE